MFDINLELEMEIVPVVSVSAPAPPARRDRALALREPNALKKGGRRREESIRGGLRRTHACSSDARVLPAGLVPKLYRTWSVLSPAALRS